MHDLKGYKEWLRKRGRERSINSYGPAIRRWLENPEVEEEKIISNKYSPNHRRFLVAALRSWAIYTENEKMIIWLTKHIKQPRAQTKSVREPLSTDEWFEIRDHIDNDANMPEAKRLVCGIIATRGIRCGDVLRITKRDLTRALSTGILRYESKGERWLEVNASPLMPYLEGLGAMKWRGGKRVRNLVCPGSSEENCQATAGRKIRSAFDQIARDLDIDPEDLYAHRFRHTYITLFLQQMEGDPEALPKLMQQMGWSNLNTASHYLSRSRRKELDAIEEQLLKR